jgi:hypothetical protein
MDMDIVRVSLASHAFEPFRSVTSVKVVRLEFAPGVVTPHHLHAMPVVGPVVGYVAEGAFIRAARR